MKKEIIFKITAGMVCLLIGLGIGYWLGNLNSLRVSQEKLAEKEISWWKSQLEPFYPPLPEEIYSISGKITKIEGNSIWVEAQIRVSQFPLPGGKEIETKEIKVNTNDETKIVKVEIPEIPPLPPEEPFREVPLKFEDLKIGDQVTVISKENIKGKVEILADKIQLTY